MNTIKKSPFKTYLEHCERGELAYQVAAGDDKPIFYPRLVAPATGKADLQWRVSKGTGTVYAATTVHRRNEEPYNVSLIDLDEGFRMMSRVEDIPAENVKIGMRVKVRMRAAYEKTPAYPVFVPLEAVS